MGIGQEFHKATALVGQVLGLRPGRMQPIEEQPARRISLPVCEALVGQLDHAIRNRRSIRDFDQRPIKIEQLAHLLFAGLGQVDHGRTVPSAGGLYPLELYAIANRIDGIDKGLYRYLPAAHALELLIQLDISADLAIACLGQESIAQAAAVFAIVAQFERTCRKYGDRGYRYVYIEAGHISQDIYLVATALGLGSVAIGAFFDRQVNDLLGLDGERKAAIYLHAVGHPASSP